MVLDSFSDFFWEVFIFLTLLFPGGSGVFFLTFFPLPVLPPLSDDNADDDCDGDDNDGVGCDNGDGDGGDVSGDVGGGDDARRGGSGSDADDDDDDGSIWGGDGC